MTKLLLEKLDSGRQHQEYFDELLEKSRDDELLIATAYLTNDSWCKRTKGRKVRLLIGLTPMDIVSGATSLDALENMLRDGFECRVFSSGPRFHAKVYIFGPNHALVTSANLTNNALGSNVEAGVVLDREHVDELSQWFEGLWNKAKPLSVGYLDQIRREVASLSKEYKRVKQETETWWKTSVSPQKLELCEVFDHASQFFWCNTDRHNGEKTETGEFVLEQAMYQRGFAAAWADPTSNPKRANGYQDHFEKVQSGDVVFMYAKELGVIGVGVAIGVWELLESGDSKRIRISQSNEYRVPVKWLMWDAQDRCRLDSFPSPVTPLRLAFLHLDLSKKKKDGRQTHLKRLEKIKSHFLSKREQS